MPPAGRMRPSAIAAVVLLAGFGVMAALSLAGRWEVRRDMWHYRAATWGDVLLVPCICAIVAAGLADPRLPRSTGERGWALAGGALFAAAGLLVQASWLASERPILNWTLPEPHRFSFPGWYHACFLVVLSGMLGAAGFVLARRVRRARADVRDALAREPATAALLGCGIAFGSALAFDSADSLDTSAGQGSALGALGAAGTAILLAGVVLGARRSVRPVMRGIALAAVLTAATLLTHGVPG